MSDSESEDGLLNLKLELEPDITSDDDKNIEETSVKDECDSMQESTSVLVESYEEYIEQDGIIYEKTMWENMEWFQCAHCNFQDKCEETFEKHVKNCTNWVRDLHEQCAENFFNDNIDMLELNGDNILRENIKYEIKDNIDEAAIESLTQETDNFNTVENEQQDVLHNIHVKSDAVTSINESVDLKNDSVDLEENKSKETTPNCKSDKSINLKTNLKTSEETEDNANQLEENLIQCRTPKTKYTNEPISSDYTETNTPTKLRSGKEMKRENLFLQINRNSSRVEEMRIHKCGRCNYETRHQCSFARHKLDHTTIKIEAAETKSGYWYVCRMCHHKTSSKIAMLKHKKVHKCCNNETLEKMQSSSPIPFEIPKVSSLKSPFQMVLPKAGIPQSPIYQCNDCIYKSTISYNLRRHMDKCHKMKISRRQFQRARYQFLCTIRGDILKTDIIGAPVTKIESDHKENFHNNKVPNDSSRILRRRKIQPQKM